MGSRLAISTEEGALRATVFLWKHQLILAAVKKANWLLRIIRKGSEKPQNIILPYKAVYISLTWYAIKVLISEGVVSRTSINPLPSKNSLTQSLLEMGGGGIHRGGSTPHIPYSCSLFHKYVSDCSQRQGTDTISMDVLILKWLRMKDSIFGLWLSLYAFHQSKIFLNTCVWKIRVLKGNKLKTFWLPVRCSQCLKPEYRFLVACKGTIIYYQYTNSECILSKPVRIEEIQTHLNAVEVWHHHKAV